MGMGEHSVTHAWSLPLESLARAVEEKMGGGGHIVSRGKEHKNVGCVAEKPSLWLYTEGCGRTSLLRKHRVG